MNSNDFTNNILSDIKVDLSEEFDRNFERKAFFDKAWRKTNLPNSRGSLLMRSGKLRHSIRATQNATQISWSSSLPYATIQNEGGEIIVTEKMRKFFWAMYYKASGAAGTGKSQRSIRLSAEAKQWRNLALMKVGQKMTIEKRQFIGDHPTVRLRVEEIVDFNFNELQSYFYNQMKQ